MKLESSAFKDGESIPAKYTCDGDNISPPLLISDVPTEAKTITLIMDDPDVPKSIRSDGVWDHWIVWNLPAGIERINEGERLPGVYGTTTSGRLEYGGPCPPDREHRYFFRLYALDSELTIKEGSDKKNLLDTMEGHVLDRAELMGIYKRT
jgi:Raf kinase inhibitor-like YbhB/YbcL family protein